ncbi:hypothetical protein A2U01_0078536, partial [Trifolium medium]|nr:hypothetical protein [Trifolium medium]
MARGGDALAQRRNSSLSDPSPEMGSSHESGL